MYKFTVAIPTYNSSSYLKQCIHGFKNSKFVDEIIVGDDFSDIDEQSQIIEIIKVTSDNSGYTGNNVSIQAKLDAAVGSATVLTIKMVSTDGASDTTYTSGNLSSIPTNPNEAPRMTLALIEHHPTDAQGLAAAIQVASNAEVSNSSS